MNTNSQSNQNRIAIFLAILLTSIASSLLSTALNTALPAINAELHIDETLGQWLSSGYSLTMAIMMPVTAFLVKRFRTKALYCTAIAIFIAGLVLSAMASSFPMMMGGRVLQAAAGGVMTSVAQVVTLTIFPKENRGTAMGWYGLALGAAPIVAPTIGGILVDTMGWRAIFVLTIVLMSASLIYALIVMKNVLANSKPRFDVLSFVLSALAFGGVTLGIGNIGRNGFTVFTTLTLVVGIVSAVIFVLRQNRLETAFLDVRILKNRDYTLSVLGSMSLYLVMMACTITIPLYIQRILGYSATISGLVVLPGALATTILNPFAGKIYDRLGIRVLLLMGAALMVICNLGAGFLTMDTSLLVIGFLNVLRNIAVAFLLMPLVTWGASSLPQDKTSDATALLTSLRTISGAIGSAVFVALMNSVQKASVATYGTNAAIHGFNVTNLVLAVFSGLLFAVAFAAKPKKGR